MVAYSAGCIQCDVRPSCGIPFCLRPLQLGDPRPGKHPYPGPCMPYRRGLVHHFDTEPELAQWEALHVACGDPGAWSLRVKYPS